LLLPDPDSELPPGYTWIEVPGGWSMQACYPGDAAAAAQPAAHRKALVAFTATQAQAERDSRISARVTEAVAKPPRDCRVTGKTPARAELLTTHKWIDYAERQAAQAHDRLARVRAAAARRDTAINEITDLDALVRLDFERGIGFDSKTERPPDRTGERAQLRGAIDKNEIEASLAEAAGFEAAVADSVVATLTERLSSLRCNLLLEAIEPQAVAISALLEDLAAAYQRLCSMGVVTNLLQKAVAIKLPALPFGDGRYQVEVGADQGNRPASPPC
jgi:hypothetical protein